MGFFQTWWLRQFKKKWINTVSCLYKILQSVNVSLSAHSWKNLLLVMFHMFHCLSHFCFADVGFSFILDRCHLCSYLAVTYTTKSLHTTWRKYSVKYSGLACGLAKRHEACTKASVWANSLTKTNWTMFLLCSQSAVLLNTKFDSSVDHLSWHLCNGQNVVLEGNFSC